MEGMTTTSGPRRRALVLVVALLAAVAGSLAVSAPAAAARTVDVVLTAAEPTSVALQPGDSVRFVSGETSLLVPHRVTATERDGSTPWQFDSGTLGPGQASEPYVFSAGGSYVFVDRRGGLLGTDRIGRVAVTAPAPAAQPPPPPPQPAPPPPARAPAPAAPAAPPPAAPAPAAPAPGPVADAPAGSGPAALPGLGGFIYLRAF
jgi:plastocyanin